MQEVFCMNLIPYKFHKQLSLFLYFEFKSQRSELTVLPDRATTTKQCHQKK